MKRLAFIGECMIELRDTGGAGGTGGTGGGGAMHRTFGGDTLNSAVYAARCLKGADAAVEYVTILGDDPFSTEMLAAWRAEGVGTELVTRRAGALPGLYAIRTDSSGERSFHYWRSESPARRRSRRHWRISICSMSAALPWRSWVRQAATACSRRWRMPARAAA